VASNPDVLEGGDRPNSSPERGDSGKKSLDCVSKGHLQFSRHGEIRMINQGLAGLDRLVGGMEGPRTQRLLGSLAFVLQLQPSGETAPFYLAVADGKADAAQGEHPNPTATITGAEDALLRVIDGEIDVTHLLASGELSSSGDYYHVIDLSRLALAVQQSRPR